MVFCRVSLVFAKRSFAFVLISSRSFFFFSNFFFNFRLQFAIQIGVLKFSFFFENESRVGPKFCIFLFKLMQK